MQPGIRLLSNDYNTHYTLHENWILKWLGGYDEPEPATYRVVRAALTPSDGLEFTVVSVSDDLTDHMESLNIESTNQLRISIPPCIDIPHDRRATAIFKAIAEMKPWAELMRMVSLGSPQQLDTLLASRKEDGYQEFLRCYFQLMNAEVPENLSELAASTNSNLNRRLLSVRLGRDLLTRGAFNVDGCAAQPKLNQLFEWPVPNESNLTIEQSVIEKLVYEVATNDKNPRCALIHMAVRDANFRPDYHPIVYMVTHSGPEFSPWTLSMASGNNDSGPRMFKSVNDLIFSIMRYGFVCKYIEVVKTNDHQPLDSCVLYPVIGFHNAWVL